MPMAIHHKRRQNMPITHSILNSRKRKYTKDVSCCRDKKSMPSEQNPNLATEVRTMQNGTIKKGGLISLEEELSNTKNFDRFDDRKLKRIVKTQDSRLTLVKQDDVALCSSNKKPKLSCSTKVADSDNFSNSDLGRAVALSVKAVVRARGRTRVLQQSDEKARIEEEAKLKLQDLTVAERIEEAKNLKLQKRREAERNVLEKMVKTVEFNDDLQVLKDFERLISIRENDVRYVPSGKFWLNGSFVSLFFPIATV